MLSTVEVIETAIGIRIYNRLRSGKTGLSKNIVEFIRERIGVDKEMRRSDALLEIRRVINNLNKKDLNDIQVQYAIGILEDVRKRIRGNDVIQISVASQKIDNAKGILVALEEYSGISERQDIGLLNNAKACVERILLYDDVIFNQYMQSAKAHLKEMKAYREEHPEKYKKSVLA